MHTLTPMRILTRSTYAYEEVIPRRIYEQVSVLLAPLVMEIRTAMVANAELYIMMYRGNGVSRVVIPELWAQFEPESDSGTVVVCEQETCKDDLHNMIRVALELPGELVVVDNFQWMPDELWRESRDLLRNAGKHLLGIYKIAVNTSRFPPSLNMSHLERQIGRSQTILTNDLKLRVTEEIAWEILNVYHPIPKSLKEPLLSKLPLQLNLLWWLARAPMCSEVEVFERVFVELHKFMSFLTVTEFDDSKKDFYELWKEAHYRRR